MSELYVHMDICNILSRAALTGEYTVVLKPVAACVWLVQFLYKARHLYIFLMV